MARSTGFEPAISSVTGRRDRPTSLRAHLTVVIIANIPALFKKLFAFFPRLFYNFNQRTVYDKKKYHYLDYYSGRCCWRAVLAAGVCRRTIGVELIAFPSCLQAVFQSAPTRRSLRHRPVWPRRCGGFRRRR